MIQTETLVVVQVVGNVVKHQYIGWVGRNVNKTAKQVKYANLYLT